MNDTQKRGRSDLIGLLKRWSTEASMFLLSAANSEDVDYLQSPHDRCRQHIDRLLLITDETPDSEFATVMSDAISQLSRLYRIDWPPNLYTQADIDREQ